MNLEPKRVLIAEDHYVSRHLLERNLSLWGFEVTAVADGESALQVLEGENPPSLVILDWSMPKMDGIEVCRRVRARKDQPFTYLLLLTARTDVDEIATAFEVGVDDYVTKPFEADELRARLGVARRVVTLERALAARTAELHAAEAELARLRGGAEPA
jgi:DNA-binding response OmpR family regulator